MKKTWLLTVAAILLFSIVALGCSSQGAGPKEEKKPGVVMGELAYETIKISSPEFEKIMKGAFAEWYQKNHKIEGLHSYTLDADRYLLLSAGEKPTGGYYLENLTLTGREKEIEVKAQLRSPQPGEYVTEALTYPHLLIRIKEDGRQLVFGGVAGNLPAPAPRRDTGKYVGQIDNNSIEIKVSGVPEKISARAFKIGDGIRDKFAALELKDGEEIGFAYMEKPNQQPVLLDIYRLKNN